MSAISEENDSFSKFSIELKQFTYGGNALGFQDEFAVFVPMGVPGDIVEAAWQKKKKTYGIAQLRGILKASSHRVAAPCPLFGAPGKENSGCGGCQWQMASYGFQLEAKKAVLAEALERIGKFPAGSVSIQDCAGMEDPWHYRNKVQYPLQRSADGKLLLGYYERKSHRIVDLEECPVQLKLFDDVLRQMKSLLSGPYFPIYDETRRQGLLRHLVLRGSERTGELLITLVTRKSLSPQLAQRLLEVKPPHLVGLLENVNPHKTNAIYGETTRTLWGRSYYHEKILDKTFRISATSFFQTNTEQTEKIIQELLWHLPPALELAVDAYCGVGVFTLFLAERAKKVIGIEELRLSLEDAKANQHAGGKTNVEWLQGKVEDALAGISGEPELIFLDPPRQGVDAKALQQLLRLKPKILIYLSCDPTTLARDLQVLVAGGYAIDRVVPFDLFPHTYHVETLVYLKTP